MIYSTINPLRLSLVFFLFTYQLAFNTIQGQSEHEIQSYIRSKSYLKDNPDSAFVIIQDFCANKRDQKDTSTQITCLLTLADIHKIKGNFSDAYDDTWDALILAEAANDTLQQSDCHAMLGRLYDLFNNTEQSLLHKEKALALKKMLINKDRIKISKVSTSYFSIAVHYSRNHVFDKAQDYIDTCLLLAEEYDLTPQFAKTEKAYIAIEQNQLERAEDILNEVSPFFIDNDHYYSVMLYYFWGNLKVKQQKYIDAISYYNKSLDAIEQYTVHTEKRPEVLEKLARIYAIIGQKQKAYSYLSDAKQISDSLYSAKNNSELLEIKNKHKETMLAKDRELAEQQIELIKKKEQNFRLKAILGIIAFLFSVGIFIFINWSQKKKHKTIEAEVELKAQLEKEKHQAMVEVKNKEITSYTLQLIDKERVIDELLGEIERHLDKKAFLKLRNSSKDFNKNLWKEFNERFTMVNNDFYKQLLEKHPSLSPTELKHCALIKLNFNGKEMAQLLNISLPSVHLARHRLRKKLGLKREDNLAKVIGNI